MTRIPYTRAVTTAVNMRQDGDDAEAEDAESDALGERGVGGSWPLARSRLPEEEPSPRESRHEACRSAPSKAGAVSSQVLCDPASAPDAGGDFRDDGSGHRKGEPGVERADTL